VFATQRGGGRVGGPRRWPASSRRDRFGDGISPGRLPRAGRPGPPARPTAAAGWGGCPPTLCRNSGAGAANGDRKQDTGAGRWPPAGPRPAPWLDAKWHSRRVFGLVVQTRWVAGSGSYQAGASSGGLPHAGCRGAAQGRHGPDPQLRQAGGEQPRKFLALGGQRGRRRGRTLGVRPGHQQPLYRSSR